MRTVTFVSRLAFYFDITKYLYMIFLIIFNFYIFLLIEINTEFESFDKLFFFINCRLNIIYSIELNRK